MKAIQAADYGAPAILDLVELPVPSPGPGDVTIDVSHAAVGLIDVLIRRGDFADHDLPMQPPFTPGIEVAGTVREVGEGVTTLSPGDPVVTLSISRGGGYAEVMAAPAAATYRLPDGIDGAAAVATLPNATTAFLALTRAVAMPADARVLILGATGALASVFPPVARRLGAREVVGVVRSPERTAEADRLGYDRVVLSDEIADALEGSEFDVIVDPVGGELRGRSLRHLADMGRLIAVGSADTRGFSVDTNELWLRNRGIVGFAVGAFLVASPELAAPAANEAIAAIADGAFDLAIEVLPLASAAEAHERLESGRVTGRLVLQP